MTRDRVYDLAIVGSGPAGIAAAYAASMRGLDYVVFERDSIASTIAAYPICKTIFSLGGDVEIIPDTLGSAGPRPTREEVLNYYRRFAEDEHRLNIRTNEPVTRIEAGRPLRVTTRRGTSLARAVLVATGVGEANRLDVPGATDDRVSTIYQEIALFPNHDVLVVGGGNSAGEAALDLMEMGARVTLSMRRPSLDRSGASRGAALQPSVRQPLERAINTGRVNVLFNSHVVEISPTTARISVDGVERVVKCDKIFALLGTTPHTELLAGAGAVIESDGVARYDRSTYETTVRNLYVVGHVTREINLLNAVRTPFGVVAAIADRLVGELDEPAPPPAPAAPEPAAPEPAAVGSMIDVAPASPHEPPRSVPATDMPVRFAEEPVATAVAEFEPDPVRVDAELVAESSLSPARVRQAFEPLLRVNGVVALALANARTREVLAYTGRVDGVDAGIAVIDHAAFVRAQRSIAESEGEDGCEDVLVTCERHFRVVRPLEVDGDIYLFVAAERPTANVAMVRYSLARAERHIAAEALEIPDDAIVSPDVRRADRVPPGQSVTRKWPVLHFGATPAFDRATWRLRIFGEVERERELDYDEVIGLPKVSVVADFHCVTRWSRLDNLWEGVGARLLLELGRPLPAARFAVIHAEGGWTTSLPISWLDERDTLFAYRHNGVPLDAQHGFPLRLVVPRLYAWKSAKWVRGVELVSHDRPGFWERAGYHETGDPWLEQRRGSVRDG